LERVPAGGQAVLTFDDGPDQDATPAVLSALAETGSHATFFLLGEQIDCFPGLVAEIVGGGHELALHGYHHRCHERIAAESSRADIVRGLEQLEQVAGIRPRWFRPPYGRPSGASVEMCRKLGLELVYWSAWGIDWERGSPERIARQVCRDLDDGAIVLLHDSARYAERPSAQPTADAIRHIAAIAHERELALVTLSEGLQVGLQSHVEEASKV